MSTIQPIKWDAERKILTLLDQRKLPLEEAHIQYTDPTGVAVAIRDLVVRGAPAIGCAAAFGMVLAGYRYAGKDPDALRTQVEDAAFRWLRCG